VRRLPRGVFACAILALGGHSDGASVPFDSALRAEPAPARPLPAEAPATGAELFAPRIVEAMPHGAQVPLAAPLVVRFDRDVPVSVRARVLALEPAVAGETRWLGARVLEFRPEHWRAGRTEHVRIAVPGAEPSEWAFRARVPMPTEVAPGNGARLVFTFDDGPNDLVEANRLLDLLSELDVRAVFFPTGRWAAGRPDWVARAMHDGHRICNHTLNHVNLTAPWMSEERIRKEIRGGAGDGTCKLFRPPLMGFDRRVERIARELGYELYLWDIDSRDWEGGPAEDVMATVLAHAKPESVVLFHMHANNTRAILTPLVERLRALDYVLSWDPEDAADARVGRSAPEARAEWLERLAHPDDPPADRDLPL
jgi:peptidoglycan-N-acetylglucosamine deacetylase